MTGRHGVDNARVIPIDAVARAVVLDVACGAVHAVVPCRAGVAAPGESLGMMDAGKTHALNPPPLLPARWLRTSHVTLCALLSMGVPPAEMPASSLRTYCPAR